MRGAALAASGPRPRVQFAASAFAIHAAPRAAISGISGISNHAAPRADIFGISGISNNAAPSAAISGISGVSLWQWKVCHSSSNRRILDGPSPKNGMMAFLSAAHV